MSVGKRYLVTGAAGSIGFHVSAELIRRGAEVTGVDSVNDYYDVKLKRDRLAILQRERSFTFVEANLARPGAAAAIFERAHGAVVIHLAAQPGVRYSLTNPQAYTESNLDAFMNVLEGCRHHDVEHLVFASSSSVYGANTKMPFSEHDNVDHPVSLYAATKKSNELLAHAYSHLYAIPVTGLRFFTVYGPWGRPDMAYFSFTDAIVHGRSIPVFNHGRMQRDFTYIDDIVEGVIRAAEQPARASSAWRGEAPDPATSRAPYRIYNIGNHQPVALLDFIRLLEELIGRQAKLEFLPMQDGDVEATFADVSELAAAVGFAPSTPLREGLRRFVDWYRAYYGV